MRHNYTKCSECKQRRNSSSYSNTFKRMLCDECFTDLNDALADERRQAAIDACYSNGEQDG